MPTHILQIKNIKELLTSKQIRINSVIYWDLDNTVFQPTKELGSDQWFGHFLKLAQSKLDASFKFDLMLKTYNAIQAHVEVTHVEPETIKIIRALKAIGIHQGFLTARNDDLKQITHRQLQQVGIDASKFPIIFCNGQDKGKMLMDSLPIKPKHIIMVDDKLENVRHIEKAAIYHNIHFTGFHYNYLLEKVTSFDIGFAHFQLSFMHHLLPLHVQNFVELLELTWEESHEDDETREEYQQKYSSHF